jgi:hypothetical protein
VFALDYALHLPVFSDVRDKLLLGKHWAGAATMSFEGALRMLAAESNPVRMPSYRPSLSGQVFYAFHAEYPLLLALRTSVYHYSNGQEYCAFDAALRDTSAECLQKIRTATDLSGSLNRINGNFSTSGWLLELHGRIHAVRANGVVASHISVGLGYAGVFRHMPGSLDTPTRALYGRGRIEAIVEAKRRMGWASMTIRSAVLHYVWGDSRVPSTAGQIEAALAPYWLTGMAVFVRYYGGRDSYNAFFVDRLQQLSAGLAWDGERPLQFWRPRTAR